LLEFLILNESSISESIYTIAEIYTNGTFYEIKGKHIIYFFIADQLFIIKPLLAKCPPLITFGANGNVFILKTAGEPLDYIDEMSSLLKCYTNYLPEKVEQK
jgi:hypothetical protein